MLELREWHLFAAGHPFPFELIDIHGARTQAMIANVNRSSMQAAYDWRDYLVISPPPKPGDAELSIADRMAAIANSGGHDGN